MAAQDAASNAVADVAGTVDKASGALGSFLNWLATDGPGKLLKSWRL